MFTLRPTLARNVKHVQAASFAWAALIAFVLTTPSHVGAQERPTVIELFTSQGCISCPPAEAFLVELAQRNDIVALEFHIDYWDYIGWKDPYADPDHSKRQKSYAHALNTRMIYTPQMVIDGEAEAPGSNREMILSLIEIAQATASRALDVSVAMGADGHPVVILGEAGPAEAVGAEVTCYLFDRERVTDVVRGDNRGKRLKNTHMVVETHRIGEWRRSRIRKRLPIGPERLRSHGGVAVVVQAPYGRVFGAAILRADSAFTTK